MGLQTGRAEAKRTAITSFRSICNLVILISSMGRALTLGAWLSLRPFMLKMYSTTCAHGTAKHFG